MDPVVHITQDTDFAALDWPAEPFCVLIIAPEPVDENTKSALSYALLDAGCRSMGAWGPDSTTWDDAGDYACILTPDLEPRDTILDMMTWWNDKDPLEEAIAFAREEMQYHTSTTLVILTFDPTLPVPDAQ